MAVADLTPAARNRVRGGITADDADDADRILAALRQQRLPLCRPTSSPQPSPTNTATPTPEVPGVAPSTEVPAGDGSPATTSSTRTTASSEPGENCREGE